MTTQISGTSGIVTSTLDLTTPLPESEGGTGSTSAYKMGSSGVITATGTVIDITGIPSWAKRITVMYSGVSLSGTALPRLQLGTSGGIESTNYFGAVINTGGTNVAAGANISSGFDLLQAAGGTVFMHGQTTLTLFGNNGWVCSSQVGRTDNTFIGIVNGSKPLGAVLDRIRLTSSNGTDAFDAGSISVVWEGF